MKRFLLLMLLMFTILLSSSPAEAGQFMAIARTGMLKLGPDKAWERTYQAGENTIKIRFRNLRFGKSKAKYHLIVWVNGKRISEGNCPEVPGGYSISVYRHVEDDGIFLGLNTAQRVVLMGYDAKDKKLHKYIDSKDYKSPHPVPLMFVGKTGDLILAFSETGNKNPTVYRLFWDPKARWFGYNDESELYVSEDEAEEDEYYEPAVNSGQDSSEEEYSEEVVSGSASVPNTSSTSAASKQDELFYEEEEVKGT
ncbi:MAG: hypothetical protein Q4D07_05830 [Selenomonadaceae bacterium]|nr:hypothetical protein [Selenomonadaceae bacterium]